MSQSHSQVHNVSACATIGHTFQTEIPIPGHTTPIVGSEAVRQALTDYRDAIQFVHDQTVRYINKGMHPDEIAQRVKLPEHIARQSYLNPIYGTVPWSVKGLYSGYVGWFSHDVVELSSLTPREEGRRMVDLGEIIVIITTSSHLPHCNTFVCFLNQNRKISRANRTQDA